MSSEPNETTMSPSEAQSVPTIIGIDFGTSKIIVSAVKPGASYADIVRNDMSEWQTANLVAFSGNERLIGETGLGRALVAPHCAVAEVTRLLGKSMAELDEDFPFQVEKSAQTDSISITIPYGGDKRTFLPEQIAAAIFARLQHFIDNSVDIALQGARTCYLSVFGGFTERQCAALVTAAKASGFSVVSVVPSQVASAVDYALRHPLTDENSSKSVVLVDVGAATTSIALATFEPEIVNVVATVHADIGGGHFDRALFELAAKQTLEKHKIDVKSNPKYRVRLLRACEKVKQTLSVVNEAELSFTTADLDVHLTVSKEQFDEACSKELAKLETLLDDFKLISAVSRAEISAVELIGGGSRMKSVQSILEKAFSAPLSRTLDAASTVALGTAVYGALQTEGHAVRKLTVSDPTTSLLSLPALSEELLRHVEAEEKEMQSRDDEVKARSQARNDLETFVIARKDNLSDPAFKDLVVADTTFENELSAASEWLDDTAHDESTTTEQFVQKLKELEEDGAKSQPKLFEKLEAIREERKKAAEDAAAAALLAQLNHSGKKKEPKTNKQKLEAAKEAKESGNKHFVDLDYASAVRRYTQALEFVMTMYDAPPEMEAEAKALKLSCYLNLAQCFLKGESYSKAIENAKAALDIEPENVKALYRRAQGLFMTKEYEQSRTDVEKGLQVNPESKEFKLLKAKVDRAIEQAKERQRKMYAAMMGGAAGDL